MRQSKSGGGLANFSHNVFAKGFKASLAVVLATSLCGAMPASAYASESDILSAWGEAAENSAAADYQPYTVSDSDSAIALSAEADASDSSLPSWYSLLDPKSTRSGILDENGKMYHATDDSVVTPVKAQDPWGTCWGFSIIAACETSILAEAGLTYKETSLDLSELQLVNAVYLNGGAPEGLVASGQEGEGYHNSLGNPNLGLNSGGTQVFGVNVFASGIGPTLESYATYRNTGVYNDGETHADDPVYDVIVTRLTDSDNADGTSQAGATAEQTKKTTTEYLTQSEIDALKDDASVVDYQKRSYAGNWTSYSDDGMDSKTVYTDWSIASQKGQSQSDDDLSWWNTSLLNLENGNELPSTRVLDGDGKFASVDWEGVNAIKNELYADPSDGSDTSRAVSISFSADNSMPGDSSKATRYISSEWAHYTNDNGLANHAVTVVGWDDNYAKENFAAGFADAAAHTPEGNGAWLVKNSWGSETGDSFDSANFPSDWGVLDAEGQHTGYFWISYYDTSLCDAESYDFDLASYSDNTEYIIDQYDYLPSDSVVVNDSDKPLYSANVFTAESDMDLRTLSCATYKQNTTVTYEVYLLDSKDAKPGDAEHSTFAFALEESYEFAGYHRTSIDEENWIPMREGQNYAVVTTQQTADGEYHQGVATNEIGQLTEEELDEYASSVQKNLESYYRAIYTSYFEKYYNSDEGKKEAEEQGLTVEQAIQKAIEDTMAAGGDVADRIDARVKAARNDRANVYFVAKVNEGESLSGAADEVGEYGGVSADVTWVDWTEVVDKVKEKKTCVVDNAPIKAFAEIADYATVDELNALKQAIAAAEAALNAAKISADGSDVATTDTWMTQEQHDALAAAIAAAKEGLAAAGDDYENVLVRTTPSSDAANSFTASLALSEQYGTKAGAKQATKSNGTYAKTGDADATAAAALACVATIAGAAAIAARRRQRDE